MFLCRLPITLAVYGVHPLLKIFALLPRQNGVFFFSTIGPISYMPHLLEAKITGSAISYLFHDSFIFYHYHERFKLALYITLTLLATTTGFIHFIHFDSKNAVTI